MAALDLSATTTFPAGGKETLSGTNGQVRRVVLPVGIRVRLSIYPLTTAANLVCADATATEAAAVTTADYPPLPAGGWSEVYVGKVGTGSAAQAAVGVVSATNSQVVYWLLEEIHPHA